MKRLLILCAALGLLAGEPALAAPAARPERPTLGFGTIAGLLEWVAHQATGHASPASR